MKGGSIGRENGKKVLMGLEKTQQGIICPLPPLQPSICGSFVLRPETSIGSTKKQKSSDSLRRIDSTLFGRASQVLAAHLISRQIGPCALIHNRSRDPSAFQVLSFTDHQSLMFLKAFGQRVYREGQRLSGARRSSSNIHSLSCPNACLSVYETTRKGILYTVCSVCDVFRSNTSWLSKNQPKIVERPGFPSIVPSFFALVVTALYRTNYTRTTHRAARLYISNTS